MMLHFVYEEVDPRTDIPGYVGITNDPNQRHEQHLDDSRSNPQKATWIQSLLNEDMEPKMRIIEIVEDEGTAKEREKYWIQTYESQGIALTNIEHSKLRKKALTPRPAVLSALAKVLDDTPPMLKYIWHEGIIDTAFTFYIQQKGLGSEQDMPLDTFVSVLESFVSEISSTMPRKKSEISRLER